MLSALQGVQAAINSLNTRLVVLEKAPAVHATFDASGSFPPAPSLDIDAITRSIEQKVIESATRALPVTPVSQASVQSSPSIDFELVEKKVKDEVKRELAKEKVMIETHILHQVEMILTKLLNEKFENRLEGFKKDLVSTVTALQAQAQAQTTNDRNLDLDALPGNSDIELTFGEQSLESMTPVKKNKGGRKKM